MNPAIQKLRQTLRRKNLDALLVSSRANVSYLSGFRGEDSFLLVGKNKMPLFITDFRYIQQAKKEIKGCNILMLNPPLIKSLSYTIKKCRFKRIGFEANHLSFSEATKLKSHRGCKFLPTNGIIENFRLIKTKSEIAIIKKSAHIAASALRDTVSYIKAGMTESDVAGYLQWRMGKRGAERLAFPPIIASGKNAAMPHAITSNKKIRMHEPIIIDCGCVFNGYSSDLTRTIFLGRIDPQFKYYYNIVKSAQQKAISSVRPGVKISEIDKIARDYIAGKGLSEYFGHAIGHGIGRNVHEAPVVSSKNKDILTPGMVFTIEPGVYMPEWGGVRIEDMVVVTDKSCRILTHDKHKSV